MRRVKFVRALRRKAETLSKRMLARVGGRGSDESVRGIHLGDVSGAAQTELMDRYGFDAETPGLAKRTYVEAEKNFRGHPQVVFRDCPLCQSQKAIPAIAAPTGKHLAGALIETETLDSRILAHLPMIYQYCAACDYFFISPLPLLKFIDLDHVDDKSLERQRKRVNVDRENHWMLEEAYVADKQKSLTWHYECSRFSNLARDTAILDIGCGTGVGLSVFHDRGFQNLWGVEPDLFSVQVMEREKPWINSKWADAYRVDLGESMAGKFGLVMFDNVLEHQTRPLQAVASAWRLLSPGGILWAAVPNARGEDFRRSKAKSGNLNFGHWSYFTPLALLRLLEGRFRDLRFYDSNSINRGLPENSPPDLFEEDWVTLLAVKQS